MPAFSHAIVAVLLFSPLRSSAASPWDGTWKLNRTTLRSIPPPLQVETSGSHYALTQGTTFHFDCDGRDYPAPGSVTLRCTTLPHGIKVERKRDGQVSSIWELNLHPDGVSMTETVTEFFPGVPPNIEHDEYRRARSSNKSVAGSWTGVRTSLEGSDALEFRIHDGFLYFHDARDGEASDAKLDGTPSPFVGAAAPSGVTWSNVIENERRIVGHALKDGRPINTEVFELSADGKSIKASQPGSPNQFQAIYEKQ